MRIFRLFIVLVLVTCSFSSSAMNPKKLPPLSGVKTPALVILLFGGMAAITGCASAYQLNKNNKLSEEDLDACLAQERDVVLYKIHEDSLRDKKIQQ